MKNDDMAILKTLIMTWNDDQVEDAWGLIADEGRRRQEINKKKIKATLKNGDHVSFTGSTGLVTGTVTKVKIKKAIVEVKNQRWDVPLHMLRKADDC